MLQQNRRKFRWLLLSCIVIISGACSTNNFSEPQPIKEENIYQLPEMFRGYWSDREFDLIFADDEHIQFIDIEEQKVLLDSSLIITEKANAFNPNVTYRQINKVSYDSAGVAYDTSIAYIIRDPFIYKITPDDQLQVGYKYKLDKDTLRIFKKEIQGIDLGNNAFLRRVSDSLYVLNISNKILIRDNFWWQVTVVEKTAKDEINYYIPSDKMPSLNCMFYKYTDNFYYDCKWDAAGIKQMIREGYFEKTNVLKRRGPGF